MEDIIGNPSMEFSKKFTVVFNEFFLKEML